jgi:hypothetical protein
MAFYQISNLKLEILKTPKSKQKVKLYVTIHLKFLCIVHVTLLKTEKFAKKVHNYFIIRRKLSPPPKINLVTMVTKMLI